MASTSLFAPQVRSVQPAFIYEVSYIETEDTEYNSSKIYYFKNENNNYIEFNEDNFEDGKTYYEKIVTGEVKIYFSFSPYNSLNDIAGILYTFIDPNKASTWGTNSMIKPGIAPAGYMKVTDIQQVDNTSTYYFKIIFNENDFKTLTQNQYYQVQLYLVDDLRNINDNGEDIDNTEVAKITEAWLNKRKDNISEPSQVTLIRPILSSELIVEGIAEDQVKDDKTKLENPESAVVAPSKIKGYLSYPDNNRAEGIKEFTLNIYDEYDNLYLSFPSVKNFLGTHFEIDLKNKLEENKIYTFEFSYITYNDYKSNIYYWYMKSFGYSYDSYWDGSNPIFLLQGLETDENMGGIKISFSVDFSKIENPLEGYILVQKASEYSNYKFWTTSAKIKIANQTDLLNFSVIDTDTDANVIYKYRFIYTNLNDLPIYGTQMNDKYLTTPKFEDIFLSNEDTMLAVRYNPNISGFKWVVQESIANSLGGKFPIIRRNGDTKYKQFSLSGTLHFPKNYYGENTDSCGNPMDLLMGEDYSTMFFSKEKAISYFEDVGQRKLLERRMREHAMDFLADGSFKLFRSFEEGTMIVYLSNVSFTPNKTLGRQVWDFSCTVTEVCEATDENRIKYGFRKEEITPYKLVLISSKKHESVDNAYWVSADRVVFDSYLILNYKEVLP